MKLQNKFIAVIFLLLIVAIALCACNEEPEVAVTAVALDKSTVSINVGESISLVATVSPENATNKAVSWESSDYFVAAVSQSGEVSGVAAGRATITVKTADGDKSAVCVITVTEQTVTNVPVTDVGISNPTLALNVGDTFTLTATVSPLNATNKTVTWSSDNPAVATVSDVGVVTAVAVGNATISVTTEDGGKTMSCAVTVSAQQGETPPPANIPVESVTLNLTTLNLQVNQSQQLIPTVLPANATNKTVTWTSSAPAIATVDINSGVVSAISAGSATITATTQDGAKTAVCQVTVTANTSGTVSVSGISLDKTTLCLNVGGSEQLTATVLPANASNKAVAWTSSNPAVATVSNTGLVTAISVGNTTVTAISADGAKTASCTVTVSAVSSVTAPEYLGIYVSPTIPSQTTPRATAAMSSDEALSFLELIWSTDRWTLNQAMPIASACDIYGNPGDTVYVEVWLNNPSQCTILSLTLSGVKYQVGGALQSYFYQGGKNCVFVEIEIPANTYVEQVFTIDQIQYVEESNAISGNGKDVMLGEKDKTVSIGLPYQAHPTVAYDGANADISYHSITLPYTVTDSLGVIAHSGAWIRACLLTSTGIGDQKIAEGGTSVSFDGLDAATDYSIIFVGYYDLRDGNGVVAVELTKYEFKTDDYLKISGTGGYHTYNYQEGGMEKQKKGAEITVNINPQEGASVTALEIYTYDNLGVPTLKYTAVSSEIKALNDNKTVTIANTSLYNDTEHELRLYRTATAYETATVKTPIILIPKFGGSDPIFNRTYTVDYILGGISDGYGGFESIPEYAEYGSYINDIWLNDGEEHRVYNRGFATSTSAIYEFLVVDHEAVAFINASDLYIYTAFMKNNVYHNEEARYEYNTDVRNVYYSGVDENGKIGQQIQKVGGSAGEYEEQEVIRPLHRYYIVDTGYVDYEALDYLYYPITYAEISIDLNDGSEPVLCKYQIGLPRRDEWASGDYSYLYQTNQNPDGTLVDYSITAEGTEITMRYNAQRFPAKLFLQVVNGIRLSDGRFFAPQVLEGSCIWKDGDYAANIPIGNSSEFKYYINGNAESGGLDETTKNDPALAKFAPRGFTYLRSDKEGSSLGATMLYLSEPIHEFSPEKLAELNGREAKLEDEWLDAYMDQILNGGGAQVEKVPIPEFVVWEEIKFNIDDSDYPCGFYAITGLVPQTTMYFSDGQPEYFAQFDIFDPSISFAYIEKPTPGTTQAPLFEIIGSEPTSVPTNVRMENGELKYEGTTDANVIDITITFERGGVPTTLTGGAYTYDYTPISDIRESLEPIIHGLIRDNKVVEDDVNIELVFRTKMFGDVEYKAPVKLESFKYTRKPSVAPPSVALISDFVAGYGGCLGMYLKYIGTDENASKLRISVNGGEWNAPLVKIQNAGSYPFEHTFYLAYMDGDTPTAYRLKYGDNVKLCYYEPGYDILSSDVCEFNMTVNTFKPVISKTLYASGVTKITSFGTVGDYFTMPVEVVDNYAYSIYKAFVEYRIDGGEIVRIPHDGTFITIEPGSTIEARFVLTSNPDNSLSTEFLSSEIVGEWASYTLPVS